MSWLSKNRIGFSGYVMISQPDIYLQQGFQSFQKTQNVFCDTVPGAS